MSDLKEWIKGFDFYLKEDTDLMSYSEFTLHSDSQIIIFISFAGDNDRGADIYSSLWPLKMQVTCK